MSLEWHPDVIQELEEQTLNDVFVSNLFPSAELLPWKTVTYNISEKEEENENEKEKKKEKQKQKQKMLECLLRKNNGKKKGKKGKKRRHTNLDCSFSI